MQGISDSARRQAALGFERVEAAPLTREVEPLDRQRWRLTFRRLTTVLKEITEAIRRLA
jgi:hypothetical protein